jgi:hypothetical protein
MGVTGKLVAISLAIALAAASQPAWYPARSAHAQAREQQAQSPPGPVDFDLSGRLLRIPERYLAVDHVRAGGRTVNSGSAVPQEAVNVAFWLSDGKPSPVRGMYLTTAWPAEAGRPSGTAADFVVSAHWVQHVAKELPAGLQSPSQHLQSALVYWLPPAERIESERHGLKCYALTRPGLHRVMCATPAGADPDVLLSADWDEKAWTGGRPPNVQWQGEIYSRADELFIRVRFPEIALARWSDVVCRTLNLVRSWEVPPHQSHSKCSGAPTM